MARDILYKYRTSRAVLLSRDYVYFSAFRGRWHMEMSQGKITFLPLAILKKRIKVYLNMHNIKCTDLHKSATKH